jgi:hypothetical protein
LHRAVNELARALAHWHFDGDGCLDPDREMLPLGGAAVITPGQTTAAQDTYDAGCERLGVVARDEGWALWHTWDDQGRPCTVVTTRPGHHPGPAGQLVPWLGPASRTATTGSDRCGARPLARADHVLTQPCHQGRPRRTLHRPDPAPSAENASECPDLRSKQARQNMLGAAHMCRCQCAVGYRGLVTLRR